MPFLERQSPQERKGETGMQETLLRGRVAGHRERQGGCWSDIHFQSLQKREEYAAKDKFQFKRTQ